MDEYKRWLKEAGVNLPEHRLERVASKLARELELRVGNIITDELTDEQMDAFEDVLTEASRRQAEWLQENYPSYAEVVANEAEQLHKEIVSAKNPAVLIKHWHNQSA